MKFLKFFPGPVGLPFFCRLRESKTDVSRNNHIYEYYQKIKDGSIIVGEYVRQIYEYLVHGLEDKLFYFDGKKANAAIEWIENHCFHVEGPLAPGRFLLELWQKALISAMFGIVDDNGNRQFREVVLVVARKNGKSLLAAAIADYEFRIDGGYGSRVYCVAPKLDQAEIIYGNTWQMIRLDPEQQELKLEIEQSKDAHNKKTADDSGVIRHRQTDLYYPETNSTFKKIAFSAKKSDGFNPSLCICDEIASWEGDKGLKQYEVMKSGMGARPEPILFSCSTSGYINDSIYDELVARSTRFLKGDSNEKRLLPFLYIVDDATKWNDINELQKSNPNLGVSVTVDYLLEEIAVAEGSLSKKREFLCKYCNIKQNSSQAWLMAQDIAGCFGDELHLEDYHRCYAVGGIDLSQTTDLTAAVLCIEKNGVINVFAHFWLPETRIDEASARDNVPYRIYMQKGWLSASGENFIDYHDCQQWFDTLLSKYKIYPVQIGYDRYSSQYLVQEMQQIYQMDDVYQGNNLTPVIREVEGLIKDKKFNFGNNDLLKIHLLNSALKMDVELNKVKLVKISPKEHIDGTAALLDAMCVRQKWWSQIGYRLQNKDR